MTAPNMDGPRRAMLGALRNAGVNPDQVDYLNAHGTSTPLGDLNESNAIKAALGDHAKKVVVNSTKSMTGHLLGGAGGLESVFTVLAVHHQKSPPTINIFNQDPECDLDYCANVASGHAHRCGAEEQLRLWWNQRFPGLQARLSGATYGAAPCTGAPAVSFPSVAITLALAGAGCVPGTFRRSKRRVCRVGCECALGVGAPCYGCCGDARRGAMDAAHPKACCAGMGAVVLGNGISHQTLYGATDTGFPEGHSCAAAGGPGASQIRWLEAGSSTTLAAWRRAHWSPNPASVGAVRRAAPSGGMGAPIMSSADAQMPIRCWFSVRWRETSAFYGCWC